MIRISVTIFLSVLLISCANRTPEKNPVLKADWDNPQNPQFDEYWYTGTAEINSYELTQARYGNLNPGNAILIFVTEDFLTESQVKKELEVDLAATSVLKLNSIHRFTTGIYDYSIMTSTFTPIDAGNYPYTLKVSASSQDWCGHTWTQINRRANQYEVTGLSYFEGEGDDKYNVNNALLEDEIWNRIRLNPLKLPQGKFDLISSTKHSRLRHHEIQLEKVQGSLKMQVDDKGGECYVYDLAFESGKKKKFIFETKFPYKILGWEETDMSGWGSSAKVLTTKATLKETIKSAYWGKHNPEDMILRKQLGLSD